MVRNLCISNGLPSRPARVWLKNTGPRLSSLIASAIRGKNGAVNSRPTAETAMSKARLISAVERDGSQVSYSSTGRSATRARRTGPARPCSGEITLSFTWRSRQSATRPPTSPGSIRSEAKITRSTPPASASKASISCSSTRLRCMSGKSSSLRRIISARSPSPSTAVTSGGVRRRQAQRARPRSTSTEPAATAQAPTAALGVTSPAGVWGRTRARIATPAAAQAASAGSSSTVRWRIATWSRS